MYKIFFSIVCAYLVQIAPSMAIELKPLMQCGENKKCLIVDTLEVQLDNTTGTFLNHEIEISTLASYHSTGRVQQAWKELTLKRGCKDVADVVVGGTLEEDGAPTSSVPGNFATHLYTANSKKNRCTLVVNYSGDIYTIFGNNDRINHHHDASTEIGRRSLTVVLSVLDTLRTRYGFKDPIRVWGMSKGAAIVESVWTIEAKNGRKTLIADAGRGTYLDACPSNNCYYMGFGYPYNAERESSYATSVETSKLWTMDTRGYMEKPSKKNKNWWRLTTFSNYSDIFYGSGSGTLECHNYQGFLRDEGYSQIDNRWNRPESAWSFLTYPFLSTSVWLEDRCGG